MPANTDPIYSRLSDIQASALVAAVASVLYNGSGTIATDVYKVWQADSTNGGFIQRLRIKYVANATTTSVACVMKVFVSSATSGAVTDATAWMVAEIPLPATGALSTTTVSTDWEIPLNIVMPASYTILVKITVAQSASCGFIVTGLGGKY